jgi:hypothetical protein
MEMKISLTKLPLTEHERAYRRGAVQAVQYLIKDALDTLKPEQGAFALLSDWQQMLKAVRDDEDPELLGTFMDTVLQRIRDKRLYGS